MAVFQLQVSNYLFSPKLVPSLITLILFPILVLLGLWQLDRAEQKREIDNGVNLAIAKPPLKLNDFDVNKLSSEVYRSATIKGQYDTQHQFLLDNKTHLGKPGYHVLTPFLFENNKGSYAVLINRGWITYQGIRENIPSIELAEYKTEILGSIKKIPRSIVLNEANDKPTNGRQTNNVTKPKLIQSIQITELRQELNYELLPIIIELNKSNKDGFVRAWQPYYGSIDKHNAYALQWFAMATILLLLFIKLNTKKG